LGRSRKRCAEALGDKPHESSDQHDKPGQNEQHPEHANDRPVRRGVAKLPPRQQPRDHFAITAAVLDSGRVNTFERWESQE
jgi:hypothetical protein